MSTSYPAQALEGEVISLQSLILPVYFDQKASVKGEPNTMWGFVISMFCLSAATAAAQDSGNYADCYHITPGIIAGIVAGDLVLTLLLLIPVYYFTHSKESETTERRDYINMIGKDR